MATEITVFVVVRASVPAARLPSVASAFPSPFDAEEIMFEDWWRIAGTSNFPEELEPTLAAMTRETGSPVMAAIIGDHEYALVMGYSEQRGGFVTWLDTEAARLDDHELEDYEYEEGFKASYQWAKAAGLTPNREALEAALTRRSDNNADDLFRLYMAGLGVPGVPVGDLYGMLDTGGSHTGWSVSIGLGF